MAHQDRIHAIIVWPILIVKAILCRGSGSPPYPRLKTRKTSRADVASCCAPCDSVALQKRSRPVVPTRRAAASSKRNLSYFLKSYPGLYGGCARQSDWIEDERTQGTSVLYLLAELLHEIETEAENAT